MNHETDIGFVDAHAEGDGGHDHLHVFIHEKILAFGAQFGIQSGMISDGFDAIGDEHIGKFFRRLAVQGIDDAALAFMTEDEFYNTGGWSDPSSPWAGSHNRDWAG